MAPGGHSDRFRCWLSIAQRAVWPHLVVFPTPSSDQNLRLYERVKNLSVQELIAKLADEGLGIAVLSRAARRDEERCHAEALQPLSDYPIPELRPVV